MPRKCLPGATQHEKLISSADSCDIAAGAQLAAAASGFSNPCAFTQSLRSSYCVPIPVVMPTLYSSPADVEGRIDALLARMTLQEKLGHPIDCSS